MQPSSCCYYYCYCCCCLLLSGLDELYVSQVDAPATPSLTPSGPVLQEQQLAALQGQLPGLALLPHTPTLLGDQGRTAPSSNSSRWTGQLYTALPAAAAEGVATATPGPPPAAADQHAVATLAAAAAPTITADGDGSGGTPVVVFLANSMGNTSYGVAQNAAVHIIRGEAQH